MQQAITTKYHGPGNKLGSRISATCQAGRVFVQVDNNKSLEENHVAARIALCEKLDAEIKAKHPEAGPHWCAWSWLSGGLPNGLIAHVSTAGNNKLRHFHVVARRWFDGVNGNTYFSGEAYADGDCVASIDFAYGYGRHCVYELVKLAAQKGVIPSEFENNRPPYQLQDFGIKFTESISDVKSREDL